jgi:O-antigen/teichoic acid export membrane protein
MLKRLISPAWAILEYGWYPLVLFATTPWFLHRLGGEHYGYWMLLTASVGFGGVLNAGTGAATIKAVSKRVGRGESNEASVRASLGIAMIGGLALSLLLLSVFWFGGDSLLGQMGTKEDLVRVTGLAAAVLLWLEQIDNVASSAMKGAERFGDAARLEIVGKTLQIALAMLATWRWPTLGALYIALVTGAVLRLSAKLWTARRLLGLSTLRPSLRAAADILHFARWGWMQGIGSVLFGVADRMIVGSTLGATSLAYYSIASQLAMQVHAISAAGLSVIFPLVSRKLEGRDRLPLWPLAKLTMGGNLVLSTLLAVVLLGLGPLILEPWVGTDAAAVVRRLLPWLVVAYWLLAINVAPFYMLLGMGQVRFVGLTGLAAGVVGVIAMRLGIVNFGLDGAPTGRGVYAIVSLVLLLPVARHLWRERGTHRDRHLARAQVDSVLDHDPVP